MTETFHQAQRTPEDHANKRTGRYGTRPLTDLTAQDAHNQPASLRCDHPQSQTMPLFAACDYITGKDFQIAYCYTCKLHVTLPAPSEADIGSYYPSGYYGSGKRFMGIVEWLLNGLHSYRAYQIEQHQRPGKVLDIGCGRGLLLNKLRQRGWDPIGTELTEGAASYARDQLKLPVIVQPLEEINFPDNEFDLVILWHVLEHVHSPRDTMPRGCPHPQARRHSPGCRAQFRQLGGPLEPRPLVPPRCAPPPHPFHAQKPGPHPQERGHPHHRRQLLLNRIRLLQLRAKRPEQARPASQPPLQPPRTRSAKVMDSQGKEENLRLQSLLALALAVPLTAMSLLYAPLIAALRRGGTIAAYATKKT